MTYLHNDFLHRLTGAFNDLATHEHRGGAATMWTLEDIAEAWTDDAPIGDDEDFRTRPDYDALLDKLIEYTDGRAQIGPWIPEGWVPAWSDTQYDPDDTEFSTRQRPGPKLGAPLRMTGSTNRSSDRISRPSRSPPAGESLRADQPGSSPRTGQRTR